MAFRKVSVGTEPTQVASYNPRRVCITIINYSGSTCFIDTDTKNITSEGFPLAVGSIMSLIKRDGDHPEEALWGQCESGTADLRVQESWSEEGGE